MTLHLGGEEMISCLTNRDYTGRVPSSRLHPVPPPLELLEQLARREPQIDPSAIRTSLILLRVASQVSASLDEEFSRFGLSQGRFTVLMLLFHAREGMSPARLAEAAGVRRPTISGLLDSLDRAGLIERRGDPNDHRASIVTMTASAEGLLKRILPILCGKHATLMSTLSGAERSLLSSLLERVREQLVSLR